MRPEEVLQNPSALAGTEAANPICAFCNSLGYPSGFCGEGSYFLSESKQYLPTGGWAITHSRCKGHTSQGMGSDEEEAHTEEGHTGVPKHRTLKKSLDFWLLLEIQKTW